MSCGFFSFIDAPTKGNNTDDSYENNTRHTS